MWKLFCQLFYESENPNVSATWIKANTGEYELSDYNVLTHLLHMAHQAIILILYIIARDIWYKPSALIWHLSLGWDDSPNLLQQTWLLD